MNHADKTERSLTATDLASAPVLASRSRVRTIHSASLPKSLLMILAVFMGFSILHTFAIVTPNVPREYPEYWVMPRAEQYHCDEPRHIAQIEYMAHNYLRLPPFETHKDMQLYADSYHPPAYYAFAAIVWAILHPLLGRSATIIFLRLLSGLLGVGVIYYTYRTARLVTTKQTALLAAACVAGVPMFVDVAASVSNEMLSAFAAAVALYYLAWGIKHGFRWRETLLMSLWIAIGICSKYTCGGIIPAAWLGLWWSGRRRGQPVSQMLQMMSVVVGLSVLSVGWFLVRNLYLYGDLLRMKAWENYWPDIDGFKERHAHTGISASRYLYDSTLLAWQSFWGNFDRFSKLLPHRIYTLLKLLHLLSFAGLYRLYRRGWIHGARKHIFLAMVLMGIVLLYQFYKFIWWHSSPQGRYFFPCMVPFGIITAAGWLALFPRRLQRLASLALMTCLFIMNVYVYVHYPFNPITVEELPPLYARRAVPKPVRALEPRISEGHSPHESHQIHG